MVHIDRMRLRLPSGFEHRASTIARLVGETMAKESIQQDCKLEKCSLQPIRVSPAATNRDVARSIVRSLLRTIGEKP